MLLPKTLITCLLLALLILCAPVAALAATGAGDSTGTQPQYGDVDQNGAINIFDLLAILRQMSGGEPVTAHSDLDANGKTNIFDLLAILRLFGDMREPLEVAGTVGGHWLTEPVVYSWSQSWDNTGVHDQYRIYSSREIDRAEFILDGDTVTGITGTTPVLLAADLDTVQIGHPNYPLVYSDPKSWKITVWDKLGNCASDSGVAKFTVANPGVSCMHGGSNNVGREIAFPLTLHGAVQCLGIKAYYLDSNRSTSTFIVDLNPEGSDSVVYGDIEQLANQIMEQVASNDSLWPHLNIFGEDPSLFISAAISKETQSITNCLIIHTGYDGGVARLVALDGNNNLIAKLGFKKWMQDIQEMTYDWNFELDPDVREQYRGR